MPSLSPTARVFARDIIDGGSSGDGVSSCGSGDGSGRGGGGEKGPSEGKDGTELESVADFDLLTFARGEGTGEWNYPWDLTGGLYR